MAAILAAGLAAWLFGISAPVPTAKSSAPAPTVVEATPSQPAQAAVPAPRIVDARLAEILALRHAGTTTYRVAENPRILLIDFPTLAEQGLTMNRLAALIEKNGAPRDRLLSDAELAALIAHAGSNAATFYLAHDYAGPALARFFSLAESEGEPINAQERHLLDLLLAAHVLERSGAGYVPGEPEMAIVSLVQPQPDDPATPQNETVDLALRDTMLRHEVSHGEFFTNAAYRAHCERFWRDKLTEKERGQFRKFLSGAGYDPSNETLMINEMQAYLMHTPDPRAFSAAILGVTQPQLIDMQRRFMDPQPPTPLLGGTARAGG